MQPGTKLAPLCREFGVSRPTGTKWVRRFKEEGYAGLEERSRRPTSSPLSLAEQLVMAVLEQRDRHPSWGAKKLHDLLVRRYGDATPSMATIARILKRAGVVRERRRRKPLSVVDQAPSVTVDAPNDVWTMDFKGWWRTHDGSRCEPLTVRDACSRFVLSIAVLGATNGELVRAELERLFKKHGLPRAFQFDNGSPFISTRARGGFTALSVWLVSLGIRIVRSRPGCPQDNGGHERMHRDVAQEVQRWPSDDLRAQQRELDRWRQEFNHVRPHEALGGKTPSDIYKPSDRKLREPHPFAYPRNLLVRRVAATGHASFHADRVYVGLAFRGQYVGFEPLDGLRWRLWFRDTDLGLVEMVPDWLDQAASEGPQMTSTISRRTTKEAARLQHERIAGGGDVQAES
jgi:transposase InsO family protein